MGIVDVPPSGTRGSEPTRPIGTGWGVPALVGAAAFWLATLVISMTPIAARYRSAMSIDYAPMLVEAAAGGLLIAVTLAVLLVRHPERVPGSGPVSKALLLGVGAFIVLTVPVEVLSKLRSRSDLADPGYWFLVAGGINVVRFLALSIAIGLVLRARPTRQDRPTRPTRPIGRHRHRSVTRREVGS